MAVSIFGLGLMLSCCSSGGGNPCSDCLEPDSGLDAASLDGDGGSGDDGGHATDDGGTITDDGGTGDGGDGPGGDDGGGPTWPPWKIGPACAAPAVIAGATLETGSDLLSNSVAVAWGGTEGAVVYPVHSSANGNYQVKLWRLDHDGKALGNGVDLGVSLAQNVPRVGVATNGSRYLACWDGAGSGQVACAVVPVGSDSALAGFSATGGNPAVLCGAGGFAVVFLKTMITSEYQPALQPLDESAAARGTAVKVGMAVPGANSALAATATQGGYAVALGTNGAKLTMFRLDAGFALDPNAVALVKSAWGGSVLAIAASAESVAAIWAEPSQMASLVAKADGSVTGKVQVDTPGSHTNYGLVGAAGGLDSFALTWSDTNATIDYRALDAGGAPQGSVNNSMGTGWDNDANAIAAMDDGFLVAYAEGMSGPNAIAVYHLQCK